MGAVDTSQIGTGRTPDEAYSHALRDAEAEYGHQEGYSGAINSKGRGYSLIKVPARMTFAKLRDLITDYRIAQEEAEYAGTATERDRAKRKMASLDKKAPTLNLSGLASAYSDKWGCPLAMEIAGTQRKTYYERNGISRRRGERLFIFFGLAPS